MVGVILAAGDGKRIQNSCDEYFCKPLIKINGKALIEYSFDNFSELKINKVYVVVGKSRELIKSAIGEKYGNINIQYVFQEEQKGLINAFVQALQAIPDEEDVILQLSDEIFFDFKTNAVKRAIETASYDFFCGITVEENEEKIKNNFSVEFEDNFVIKGCTEKPDVVVNKIKGTGFCFFDSQCVLFLKSKYDEKTNTLNNLCDYMDLLIKENKKGLALHIADKEFNINTLSDLVEASNYLK